MSCWETTSSLKTSVAAARVWATAYADPGAWPLWNSEISRANLNGPLALGAGARIVFRSGLRLRFTVVEFEPGRLFTDEARLPGARIGHRHAIEPGASGALLTNTIYIEGPLTPLWQRLLGPAAERALPEAQRAIAALAAPPPLAAD